MKSTYLFLTARTATFFLLYHISSSFSIARIGDIQKIFLNLHRTSENRPYPIVLFASLTQDEFNGLRDEAARLQVTNPDICSICSN